MDSTVSETSFVNFKDLERILCHKKDLMLPFEICPWAGRCGSWKQSHFILNLSFQAATTLTMAEIRVDVKDLLRLTSSYREDRICSHIFQRTNQNDEPTEQYTILLDTLRARVLEALARIFENSPTDLRADDFTIYINSLGHVVSIQTNQHIH